MRLIDADAVIKAVDKHTKDDTEIVLDDDITCILEEVPTVMTVNDCFLWYHLKDALLKRIDDAFINDTKEGNK